MAFLFRLNDIALYAETALCLPVHRQWNLGCFHLPSSVNNAAVNMGAFNSLGNICVRVRSAAQSCPTLCDPMHCSPPGSSVHGISQARILEWVAISSSRDLPD